MKTHLLLVFAVFCSLAVPRAHAQDTLAIPESCGSESELTREIAALRASARSNLESARPVVHLTREGDGYQLTVELPDGRRTLRDPDCRALFRAAIVIAALGQESSVENVLEASAGPREAQPPEAHSAAAAETPIEPAKVVLTRPPPPAVAPAAPRVRVPAAPRVWLWNDARLYPRVLSLRALLRAELGYGVIPELSGSFGAGVALEYAHFAARALLAYQGPPRIASSRDEGVRVQGMSASLSVELVALTWLRPGVGVDLHALHGRGLRGRSPSSAWASQPTLHAGLAFRLLRRGPFWLELSARALWAPKPVSFSMKGRGAIYSTSPWGLTGGIGAGLQFL